jgi:hypothetical protein
MNPRPALLMLTKNDDSILFGIASVASALQSLPFSLHKQASTTPFFIAAQHARPCQHP